MRPPETVERIVDGDLELAYVVRATFAPTKTVFVTPDSFKQQLGFIVYAAGSEIPRHYHLPIQRKLSGTSEVIIVRSGRCIADIYSVSNVLVKSVDLQQGDVIVIAAGGHGFRVMEDTVLMEVKQGPFTGQAEKERF
jgi:mannose-6-phosphate isomerase-like protein (cupin superfamily)